ncbi:hypothetical protein THAOC_14867, partial [Thalassiosira oceanica]
EVRRGERTRFRVRDEAGEGQGDGAEAVELLPPVGVFGELVLSVWNWVFGSPPSDWAMWPPLKADESSANASNSSLQPTDTYFLEEDGVSVISFSIFIKLNSYDDQCTDSLPSSSSSNCSGPYRVARGHVLLDTCTSDSEVASPDRHAWSKAPMPQ